MLPMTCTSNERTLAPSRPGLAAEEISMNRTVACLAFVFAVALAPRAFVAGESVGGFPGYVERVEHELTNRTRVDPQV